MAEPVGCQVWYAGLSSLTARHESVLDPTEAERAQTYAQAPDRARFVLGAVLLKLAVADAIGPSGPSGPSDPSGPGDLDAARNIVVDRTCDQCGRPHGRPRIHGGGIEVSVAHSGSVVAVALSSRAPVGIDVEAHIGEPDPALLERVLAPEERPLAPVSMREFLTYWCRKESVLKAIGEGLRVPLTDVVVTAPTAAPALLSYRGAALDAVLVDLDVGDKGYVAALAILTPEPVNVRVEAADRLLRSSPGRPGSGG